MYKIGEFSKLSKITIKALRYYEKEKLLIPSFTDSETGYRYYSTMQLLDLSRIISLKQAGFSINDIKKVINGNDIKEILTRKQKEIEHNIEIYRSQLSKVNYLLLEKNINNEIFMKELPDYTVFYKEGIVKDFSEVSNFITVSRNEFLLSNPNIKFVAPDYHYISYLDGSIRKKILKLNMFRQFKVLE